MPAEHGPATLRSVDERLRALERRAAAGEPGAAQELARARERVGQRRVAVLAGVCANLEALEAVLADMQAQGVTDAICLGDALGYGPNPVECLELLRARCRVMLMGHTESFLLDWPRNSASLGKAKAANLVWLERLLRPRWPLARAARAGHWRWVTGLPLTHAELGWWFGHSEYVCLDPEYTVRVRDHASWSAESTLDPQLRPLLRAGVVTAGWTHHPAVWEEGAGLPWREGRPEEPYRVGPAPAVVWVGAVGQPRDRDPRACYAIVSPTSVEWRRVGYDVERTVSKILANEALLPAWGRRLRSGA